MATKEKKIGGKRYDAIRKQVERKMLPVNLMKLLR